MTRPVSLEQVPIFYPHTCIRCGCGMGAEGRLFMIGLGVELTEKFNPMYEGEIYYCNLCAKNLVTDILALFAKWDSEHAPWESPDRAESSYSWKNSIDLSGIESEVGSPSSDLIGFGEGTEVVDSGIEQDDSVSEATDGVAEPTIPGTLEGNSLAVRFGVDFS